jgi:hypothetical protein
MLALGLAANANYRLELAEQFSSDLRNVLRICSSLFRKSNFAEKDGGVSVGRLKRLIRFDIAFLDVSFDPVLSTD